MKDEKTKLWGFILMAKAHHFSFFHTDEQEVNKWIEALKSSVIMLDLQREFELGQILGRGNFAQVHTAVRKKDDSNTKYAIKSMKLQTIRKSRRDVNYVLSEIDIMR